MASKQVVPTMFPEQPECATFGGFVKDIKMRETTNYQFALSGN